MVNKTVLGWDSLSQHCRNSKGTGGPQDGNETNVGLSPPGNILLYSYALDICMLGKTWADIRAEQTFSFTLYTRDPKR